MKMPLLKLSMLVAIPSLLAISTPASAGLVTGAAARTQFEGYVSLVGDTYESFDSFSALTNLTTQVSGLTFRTTVDGTGFHLPPPGGSRGTPVNLPVKVVCSPSNPFGSTCSDSNRMIGGVRSGNVNDGQSIYEIVFATGQLRAGLARTFFNTMPLTRFYSGSTLLGEYQNSAASDFVGFITDATNPISRIELDGLPSFNMQQTLVTYNVGYSDDLFFGATALPTGNNTVPTPATLLLLIPGLFALRRKLTA